MNQYKAAYFSLNKTGLIYPLLFIMALIPRAFCVMQIHHSFLFDFIPLDSEFYDQWARDITQNGFWSSSKLYPGAPLYAYAVAAVYCVFGQSFFALKITQAFLGALTTVLIYGLARKLSHSAFFAGIVFVLLLVFRLGVFYELWILSESLAVLLLVSFLLSFLWAEENPSLWRFALAGALMGLTIAAKPNLFLLWIAALVWLFFIHKVNFQKKTKWLCVLIFVLTSLSALAPISFMNYKISGEFIPFRPDAGFLLYEGNGPYANGRSSMIPFLSGDKMNMLAHAKKLAEINRGQTLTANQVSEFWIGQVFEHIQKHPGAFLKANLTKLRLLVSGFEMPDIYSSPLLMMYIPALRFLPFDFFFLIPLSIAGPVFVFFRNKQWAWMGVAALVSAASLFYSYITERYKIPLYPFVLLFSAAAIHGWFDRAVSRKRKWIAAGLFLGVLLLSCDSAFVANNRGNPAAGYNLLGVQALKHHSDDQAIIFFNQALETAPARNLSVIHANLGDAFQQSGKRTEALAEYKKALSLNPYDLRTRQSLLQLYKHAES